MPANRSRLVFLLACLLSALLLLTGCAPSAPAAPATQPPAAEPPAAESPAATLAPTAVPTTAPTAGPVVLTLQGLEQTIELTMEDLRALPAVEGQAGMKSSTGQITVPALYQGVLLTDLAQMVGGLAEDLGVRIVASDGYAMTLSYAQITQGEFITYDPSDGSEKKIDEPLRAIVAYAINGEPIPSPAEGPLRLVIISDQNNQVTDGHWAVKWVERVELEPLVKEWSLALHGVVDDTLDRNTFQSCGNTSCHQTTWTDAEGQVWSGVPLYLLAGRMDDELKHDGPAYNRDLANAGYLIELVASDGYTVTIPSADAYYNRKLLVANLVDDNPLPDKYFPLRLVGDGLEKGQQVGSLTEIRLVLEQAGEMLAEPTATATAEAADAPAATTPAAEAAPSDADLWLAGRVANPLALSDAALHALPITQISAEHPKQGMQAYEGVLLTTLLTLASPEAGATALVLTASDGYAVTVDLAAVQACRDCLLAFSETPGSYLLAMPGFESSAWVKNLAKIEVK